MRFLIAVVALTLLTGAAQAQPVGLIDAEIDDRQSVTDPAVAVTGTGDGWFAFTYPAIEGTRTPCCWKGDWKRTTEIGCSLARELQSYGTLSSSSFEDTMVVYVHTRNGSVEQLKIAGEQCPMDAEGQAVTWIGETRTDDTLDWLENLARTGEGGRVTHAALWALALHAAEGAGDRLHALARDPGGELAEEAVFWLGEARGEAGYEALEDLLEELPTGETRRQVNFALSQNTSDKAPGLLADIARNDRDPEQRGDALFWLAQEYPEEARPVIEAIIASEHDTETLERAVFAMSQLPGDIAGPALMAVVRDSDAPPEARRQALFWLAHEGDDQTVNQLIASLTR